MDLLRSPSVLQTQSRSTTCVTKNINQIRLVVTHYRRVLWYNNTLVGGQFVRIIHMREQADLRRPYTPRDGTLQGAKSNEVNDLISEALYQTREKLQDTSFRSYDRPLIWSLVPILRVSSEGGAAFISSPTVFLPTFVFQCWLRKVRPTPNPHDSTLEPPWDRRPIFNLIKISPTHCSRRVKPLENVTTIFEH